MKNIFTNNIFPLFCKMSPMLFKIWQLSKAAVFIYIYIPSIYILYTVLYRKIKLTSKKAIKYIISVQTMDMDTCMLTLLIHHIHKDLRNFVGKLFMHKIHNAFTLLLILKTINKQHIHTHTQRILIT